MAIFHCVTTNANCIYTLFSLLTPTPSPPSPPQCTTFFQGETLGEVKPGEEEVVSASDWVNRSRKKAVAMEEERLLAKQRERYLAFVFAFVLSVVPSLEVSHHIKTAASPTNASLFDAAVQLIRISRPHATMFVSRRILEEQEMELANGGGDGKKGTAAYGAENLAGLKVWCVCVCVCAYACS